MKRLAVLMTLPVCLVLALAGCSSTGTQANSLPISQSSAAVADTMRVGDKITIRLSGIPDPTTLSEILIPPSGDITVDLLSGSFHAAGRTPAQLSADLTTAYRDQKIYTNPTVEVIPEERYVNVGGDVRAPSRIVYTPDATVMTIINAAGGFDEYANRKAVRVIRGSQVYQVDCVKAALTPGADPAVYPGDQIYVPRTML